MATMCFFNPPLLYTLHAWATVLLSDSYTGKHDTT